jgi:hypothetical protein
MKFTFKTEHPTGRYRSFGDDYHIIKLNKITVGSIDHEYPFTIRLQVIKTNILEDGNPNCPWKLIRLKKQSSSLQEAKDFLNEHFTNLTSKYSLINNLIEDLSTQDQVNNFVENLKKSGSYLNTIRTLSGYTIYFKLNGKESSKHFGS